MTQAAFPASFAQQRLWFLDQLEPGTAAYKLPRAFRITGPLNVDFLTRSFQKVIQRHASLRTVFDSVEGEARQIRSAHCGPSTITVRDISFSAAFHSKRSLPLRRDLSNADFLRMGSMGTVLPVAGIGHIGREESCSGRGFELPYCCSRGRGSLITMCATGKWAGELAQGVESKSAS